MGYLLLWLEAGLEPEFEDGDVGRPAHIAARSRILAAAQHAARREARLRHASTGSLRGAFLAEAAAVGCPVEDVVEPAA
eukprot:3121522-Lingulodinium_polyedra.AAC.1